MVPRIAVLSDVHGSALRLRAVLEQIQDRGIKRVWCLGDVIGYGRDGRDCWEGVTAHCEEILLGNHEAMAARLDYPLEALHPSVASPLQQVRQELSGPDLQRMAALPLTRVCEGAELCHASLDAPALFVHLDSRRAIERHFRCQVEAISFFGHTHVPVVLHRSGTGRILRAVGRGRFSLSQPGLFAIGVGSVAFSRDNDPRSSWVEFDPQDRSVFFHRVDLDEK